MISIGMSQPESQTSILDPCRFPPELLQHIFRHLRLNDLKSAILVCRHWRDQIVASPSLMDKFVLVFSAIRPLGLDHPGVRYIFPRNVTFEDCILVSIKPWWAALGPKLVRITLQEVKVELPTLMAMLREATNLKELNILDSNVTKSVDFECDFRFKNLELLVIKRASPGLLNALKPSCIKLKKLRFLSEPNTDELDLLDLVRNMQHTLKFLMVVPTENVLEAISKMDQLQLTHAGLLLPADVTLTVEFCRLQHNLTWLVIKGGGISESILAEIGQLLPNLKSLAVFFEEIHYEPVSMQFLSTMSKLESLFLIGEHRQYKRLDLIKPSWCSNLKKIDFKNIAFHPNETWQFLASSNQINMIKLTICILPNWSQFTQALGSAPSLTDISLHNISVREWPDAPAEFTNNGIKILDYTLPHIPLIHLESLIYSFPKLEELYLHETPTADDDMVQHLGHRFPSLRCLVVDSCSITDDSVRHIYQHPGMLKKLVLRPINGVSQQEVERLREKINTVIVSQKLSMKVPNRYVNFVKRDLIPSVGIVVTVILLSRLFEKVFK